LAHLMRKPDQKLDLKRSEGETAAAETSGAFYSIINQVGRGESSIDGVLIDLMLLQSIDGKCQEKGAVGSRKLFIVAFYEGYSTGA